MASIVARKQLLKATDTDHIFFRRLVQLVVPYSLTSSAKVNIDDIVPEYNQLYAAPCKACQCNHLVFQDCLQYKGCCAADKSV
jgi:hypothetical protein